MRTFDLRPLLRQAELHRNEVVEFDGISMPKSAAMLMSALATESDRNARFELYLSAISECRATSSTAAAVKLAEAEHQEFRDVTSLIILSDALTGNNEPEAGISRAKEALELAIEKQVLVNYAAGHLVRLSVKSGSVETVNEALEALVDSTQVPRTQDCVLEADWCDDAEALGADVELISWVRSVAAKQIKQMNRRKRKQAAKP